MVRLREITQIQPKTGGTHPTAANMFFPILFSQQRVPCTAHALESELGLPFPSRF